MIYRNFLNPKKKAFLAWFRKSRPCVPFFIADMNLVAASLRWIRLMRYITKRLYTDLTGRNQLLLMQAIVVGVCCEHANIEDCP